MGLHDALRPPTTWVWRWYTAYNARAGRKHLLRVPLVLREQVRVPSWYYNEHDRDEYRRRQEAVGPTYFFPYTVYPESPLIQRLCSTTQRAYRWVITDWWQDWRRHEEPPRGWCKRCWELAQTMTPRALEGPPNVIQSSSSRSLEGDDENLTRWIRYEQGYDD
jgi:hypothetical protein